MLSNRKAHFVWALVLSAGTLDRVGQTSRLAAQGTTGTVLGTVTDSSGGTMPEATIRVTNSGTNATQIVTSDAQGRYRVPDLPVGDYQSKRRRRASRACCPQGSRSTRAPTWWWIFLCSGTGDAGGDGRGRCYYVETTLSAIRRPSRQRKCAICRSTAQLRGTDPSGSGRGQRNGRGAAHEFLHRLQQLLVCFRLSPDGQEKSSTAQTSRIIRPRIGSGFWERRWASMPSQSFRC